VPDNEFVSDTPSVIRIDDYANSTGGDANSTGGDANSTGGGANSPGGHDHRDTPVPAGRSDDRSFDHTALAVAPHRQRRRRRTTTSSADQRWSVASAQRSQRSRFDAWALAGWTMVLPGGWVAIAIATGLTGPHPTAIAQAVAPVMLLGAIPATVIAVVRRRRVLQVCCAALGVAQLSLVGPVVLPRSTPAIPAGSTPLRVTFVNANKDNQRTGDAIDTLMTIDTDVLAVAELTPMMADAIVASGRYPFAVSRPIDGTEGIGLFSRYPLTGSVERWGVRPAVAATIDVEGAQAAIAVVHVVPPFTAPWRNAWAPDLATVRRELNAIDGPTIVVGDFNATVYHPPYRAIVNDHFTDVHVRLGQGLSGSFPSGVWPAPWIRIDHALVRDTVATDIADVAIPGSDHLGFTTTVHLSP
jgi:endonuclease/exonuclease/phosphatase (EEP) superfamily protein YafD